MRCSAINCSNSTSTNQSKEKLFYFRFPSDNDLCKLWVLCCRRLEFFKEEPETLHLKYKICSQHFVSDMIFMKNGNAYLMNNAIPTVFDFPVVFFDEPSPAADGDDHGYSRPMPGTQVRYELLTRVVEISQGKYFVSGGALLNPGALRTLTNANQICVLLAVVKGNKVSKIICESVCSCYLLKSVLMVRSARYWLKRLNNKFPPGNCEVTKQVSSEEFYKEIVLDRRLRKAVLEERNFVTSSEPEEVITPNNVSSSTKKQSVLEPPPLATPQSVLLLTKKRTKKVRVLPQKPPSVQSGESGTNSRSQLDSLLALQCDPQSVEPFKVCKSEPLPVEDGLSVDLEQQKCSEWIEKHVTYFKSKNVEDGENDKEHNSPGKECNKLIVQLSNAPISDNLKQDLVTLLAENQDKSELETVVDGKAIKATKQLIKVPVQSVNGTSLQDIKKQLEGALGTKVSEDISASQISDMTVCIEAPIPEVRAAKRSADNVTTERDELPKKFRKLAESNSKIPPHIRNIILRNAVPSNACPQPSKKVPGDVAPTSRPSASSMIPMRPNPCLTCIERAKKPPPPPKVVVRQLKDFPEYLLLKKQLSAAKRRVHKLEKASRVLKEKVRNPPKIKVERVLEEVQKYLTMDAFTLVQSTVMHNAKDVGPHGHRFSDQLKNLGYRLMLSGVQVYKCFAHIFNLPCTTTMKKWISQYEKKHIDSLFTMDTNKGESLGHILSEEDEEEEADREDSEEQEETMNAELAQLKPSDHSYSDKQNEEETENTVSQEEALVETTTFLAHPTVKKVILEEGEEAYEIHENGEVAALEVILEDGEEVPLQIPIEQLYALQQHYVIET